MELELPGEDVKIMRMLEERGLKLRFSNVTFQCLEQVLQAARIVALNETERYFLEDDEVGMISIRNEMAALGMIRSLLVHGKDLNLEKLVLDKLDAFGSEEIDQARACTTNAEACLTDWAKQNGVKSNVFIADFERYGRGAAAAIDLKAGDLVLEIPRNTIISEEIVMESDMEKTLASNGDGIGTEVMSLLWSISERTNQHSKYAPYFSSLPEVFRTGLSFGVEGLLALEGSMAFEQIYQAKEHLRLQYDNLFPRLSDKYPDVFPKALYTWENFLWASELWYSNSVKISFPDGKIRTCLVPMLGMLNHSNTPHITHFSKIDLITNSLKVHTLRSCKAGTQCFLSYGTLPNIDLMCFYGFVIGNNAYDTIPVELEMPESPSKVALMEKYEIGASHLVRAPWLSNSKFTKAGVPTKLLAALRIAHMDDIEAEIFSGNPRLEQVSPENEKAVAETIVSVLDALSAVEEDDEDSSSWDASLANEFKQSQSKIYNSITQNIES